MLVEEIHGSFRGRQLDPDLLAAAVGLLPLTIGVLTFASVGILFAVLEFAFIATMD